MYSIVNLPLHCENEQKIIENTNIMQIIQNVYNGEQEIKFKGQISTGLIKNICSKSIFKIKKYQKKDDPSQTIDILEYLGEAEIEYNFQYMEDFHFQQPLPEQELLQHFQKLNQQDFSNDENRVGMLNEQMKNFFYYFTRPQKFLKNFKHQKADIYRAKMKINENNNSDNINNVNNSVQEGEKKTQIYSICLNYDRIQEIPSEPIKQNDFSIKDNEIYYRINQMFEERPIWLKNSLIYFFRENFNLKITPNQIKKVLAILAYNFKNGPWKHCYIKFGYDPRISIESAKFQVIDIAVIEKDNIPQKNYTNELYVYDPTFNEKPQYYRHLYQICDVADPNIKRVYDKAYDMQKQVSNLQCVKKSGWFNIQQIRRIQKIMKDKFKLIA